MANPCGKNCGECAVRDEIRCGGCASVILDTGCEIAECVSMKNHESCETCTMRPTCPTRRHAASMHLQRKKAEEEAQEKEQRLAENAKILAKWLYPMFWIAICQIPFSLAENLTDRAVVKLVVDSVLALSNLLYAFCLWKMQAAEKRYRTAALFDGGAALLNVLRVVIFDFLFADLAKLSLIFTLPAAVLMFASMYHTYNAHSWVTAEADPELSDNWEKLWKWEVITLAGTLCSPILAVLGLLGVLALLALMVFSVIVDVLALVYLRRTAELMKLYAEE